MQLQELLPAPNAHIPAVMDTIPELENEFFDTRTVRGWGYPMGHMPVLDCQGAHTSGCIALRCSGGRSGLPRPPLSLPFMSRPTHPPTHAHIPCPQAFLSLCQGNHYQFDSLRRAKHSSMMVLYHLHNPTVSAAFRTVRAFVMLVAKHSSGCCSHAELAC